MFRPDETESARVRWHVVFGVYVCRVLWCVLLDCADEADLPELQSIQMSENAFQFNNDDSSMLVMRSDSMNVD